MFESWGSVVHRGRWVVIAVVLAVTVLGGLWGSGVFGKLSQGGYADPASQSAQAADLATSTFGNSTGDVVVVYTAPPRAHRRRARRTAGARRSCTRCPPTAVRSVTSYWQTHSPLLVTADHRHALADHHA